ncbi:hypothetical protein BT96DRAFT_996863 [Gymnopus androsaceus JB14]|uniref:Uncharacterized protein n=1 Tax=Gymnopus androsaceus JB14 TaxID=1447944 RepID=A0A6A4HGK4_9AGAR|nr:hypothetical protein BT96DRAFT_996863 [Gymnopus androsaceus JB14]
MTGSLNGHGILLCMIHTDFWKAELLERIVRHECFYNATRKGQSVRAQTVPVCDHHDRDQTMAVESLPNELIDCILDNFSSDKNALSNCSLIEKAFFPCQHRIFEKLELDGRFVDSSSSERLIAIFDEKRYLASSVRLLNLRNFNLERPEKDEVYARIAEGVIQRLYKVDTIEFNDVRWQTLSPFLRTALFDAFEAPSLTRIAITMCLFPTFADLASLLSRPPCLKALTIRTVFCGSMNEPTASDIVAMPRSITLDEFSRRH